MAHKPAILPLICFAVLAAVFAAALLRGNNPAILPSALIGKPAPIELKDIGTPVAVNFFASWCTTCAGEQDTLLTMQKDGVTVIGIAYKDTPDNIKGWLKLHGNPFSTVEYDEKGRAAIDWGVYGVPETYFIDRSGIIRHKHVGALSMESYTATIKPILEGMKK